MFSIRYAAQSDAPYWYSLEKHMAKSEFDLKVRDRRCYLIGDGDRPVGILRYGLFWDNTPFLNLLYLEEGGRGKGFGTKAMAHWEKEMRALGYEAVMASTQADEKAQHFYRKIGYRDCGCLMADEQEALEIFLIKRV